MSSGVNLCMRTEHTCTIRYMQSRIRLWVHVQCRTSIFHGSYLLTFTKQRKLSTNRKRYAGYKIHWLILNMSINWRWSTLYWIYYTKSPLLNYMSYIVLYFYLHYSFIGKGVIGSRPVQWQFDLGADISSVLLYYLYHHQCFDTAWLMIVIGK